MTRHAGGGRGKRAALAFGLALIAAGVVGLALTRGGPVAGPPLAQVPAPDGPAASVPRAAAASPVAAPVRLTIPVIGVRTRLVRLGLTKAGALQVPVSYQVAGWYDRSPRPGATGPGVFFRLVSLHRGDRAYVRRADGSLVVFRVTSVRLYPKTVFPPPPSMARPPARSCASSPAAAPSTRCCGPMSPTWWSTRWPPERWPSRGCPPGGPRGASPAAGR